MEDLVKEVIALYPQFGRYDPSKRFPFTNAGALWSDDGKHVYKTGPALCHSYLFLRIEPNLYDNMITSYPNPDVDWFNFLKTHLFKKWADHFELCEQDKKHYVFIKDLANIPANILQNFCILTRYAWEVPQVLEKWKELCATGIHPGFAFACLHMTEVIKFPYDGHKAVDNTSSVELLVMGAPNACESMFKTHPKAVIPCNIIWGTSQDLRVLTTKSVETFWNDWKSKHEDLLLAS